MRAGSIGQSLKTLSAKRYAQTENAQPSSDPAFPLLK
jgi:hypothetical protein